MTADRKVIPAREALARLKEGNGRYVQGVRSVDSMISHGRRGEFLQNPIAIVLGCSDSRAPAEIVFDQGLGDLFVIRVAGNIVAPSQVGSVEFAALQYGTRLVVVMGHTQCGAVTATLDELQGRTTTQSRNLRSIVDRVRPSVQTVLASSRTDDYHELLRASVRANVRASAGHLRHGSWLLEQLSQDNGLVVVGGEYSLETGTVDFFDGVPTD